MQINLGLDNKELYDGCEIKEVGGRLTLITPPEDASNIIGRNIRKMMMDRLDLRAEATLTGPMAVWAYLVIFHLIVHLFTRVYYDDGRNPRILIAQH
jgi:hypothetical protein